MSRAPGQSTPAYLAAELHKAGLSDMARKASEGHYDDFLSPLATPAMALHQELTAAAERGYVAAPALIDRLERGEFDATFEESERWAESPEAQQAFGRLLREMDSETVGDTDPPTAARNALMKLAARKLEAFFPGMGFCLTVFDSRTADYISNARREDMIAAMRETADRLEAPPD